MVIETGLILSFASWLGSKIADKGFDAVYEKLTKRTEIDDKFNKCVIAVANDLEKKYPDILGNSISYFFTREEVFDELCKLLFVNQDVNIEIISESFDESTLPNEFIYEFVSALRVKLSGEHDFQELIANKEIFIAIKGISKDVNELSKNSSLSIQEIKAIKNLLERRFKDKFNLQSFLALYLKNLMTNLGTVNFIGLGIDPTIKKGKRKELDSIFVKPHFIIKSKYHIEEEIRCERVYQDEPNMIGDEMVLSYKHIFDRPYNYVILGNPGSGKSLLIKSIICNIAQKKKVFSNDRLLKYIPFRIELKNYLSFKRSKGGGILKYLAYVLEEEYSVPSVLEENLKSVLENEKTMLFFDGLDEIFNATDKLNIKNDIENFHNLFPKIRSITTSRFIGYNEAKLNEEKFCELNILSFNEDQIKEYVAKWYSLEEENIDVRNSEISDCISKMVNVDNELVSNPLLLSLIVILYRNNLRIPDSKLEIYESCTNTLVDKWDASKNLDIQLPETILQKKEPIFSDLAFWQYEILSSHNTAITYYKAKSRVERSLVAKKLADEDNCELLSEAFLNYAQKRSIYFDNNFTHKTFLEYYTAYWVYSNIEKKHKIDDRNQLIKKYITNPFWYIVLELLLNMIDKDQPDTEILDTIFKEVLQDNGSLPFLIYMLPNLKNISNEVSLAIYQQAIVYLSSRKFKSDDSLMNKDLFSRLQKNASLSKQIEIINKAINSINLQDRNLSFYVLLNELKFSPKYSKTNLEFSQIFNSEQYIEEVKRDSYLFHLGRMSDYDDGKVGLPFMHYVLEFLSYFDSKEFYKEQESHFDSYTLIGFIHYYLYFQLKNENIASLSKNLDILEDNSISKLSLIKYLGNTYYIPKMDISSANYLCKEINASLPEKNKIIYILLLVHSLIRRLTQHSESKISIEELDTSKAIKGLLRQILRLKDLSKILDILIIEFTIKDEKLLQLSEELKLKKSKSKKS